MADTGSLTKRKLQKFTAKASDPIVSGFPAVQNVWSAWASLTDQIGQSIISHDVQTSANYGDVVITLDA